MRTAFFLLALFVASFPALGGELVEYASKHYKIYSDLDRDQVLIYARHMDQVFINYENRFKEYRARNAGPMPLYLFAQQQDYIDFMAKHNLAAQNSGGMFFVQRGIEGLATWTSGRSRSQTFAVLQHEGFHQFAFNYIGPELPTWLNEGLAQYFEDGIIIRKKMKLGLSDADRIERVRQAITNKNAVPLNEVLQTSGEAWSQTLANDPDRSALLYAQSWSLCYFLIHGNGGRYQQALSQYLKLISDGRESSQAFRTAFGVEDLSLAEKKWRDFARKHQPDPVTDVVSRLEFFGVALQFLRDQGERMPTTFSQFKHNIQQRRFSVQRRSTGVVVTTSAEDDEIFRFKNSRGGYGKFRLLEPARDDLPPRISAMGLRPEPTLVWFRTETGELVADIEFR